jgi:hypothetical protein
MTHQGWVLAYRAELAPLVGLAARGGDEELKELLSFIQLHMSYKYAALQGTSSLVKAETDQGNAQAAGGRVCNAQAAVASVC